MEKLIRFFESEWNTLSNAPLTFLLLVVISFLAAFWIINWRYESIVEQLREQINTLRGRLQSKDDQLGDYRERLKIIPTDHTAYSNLTNNELRDKTLSLVEDIRNFLRNRRKKQNKIHFQKTRKSHEQMTEEEKEKEWQKETQELLQDSFETNSTYEEKFKVDTILLRDELLSRLPKDLKNEQNFSTYEHPTNPIGMGIVADDLERLAKSLPDRNGV